MPGYKVQVKKEDGGMQDIPLAAQYDGNGREISAEYATKASVNVKYTKPSSGIPEDDLEQTVRDALSKAKNAGEKTSGGGFKGGDGTSAGRGAAIGDGAVASLGGAVGAETYAQSGGAVGYMASSLTNGFAGGQEASAQSGAAVGFHASATSGGAVGDRASAKTGFAGGVLAVASANGAVQLGQGENVNTNTLQFREYQIVDENGLIPAERLSNIQVPVTSVNGKTGAVNLTAANVGAATESYVDSQIAAAITTALNTSV